MNPYVKLALKSFVALILGFGSYSSTHAALNLQQNLVPFLMSGLTSLAIYLGGALDTTPAPWQSPPGPNILPPLKPVWILFALLLIPAIAWAQPAQNFITRPDVSVSGVATQLCPQNASRIDCSCTNNDAGTAIRVGDNNITATRGQRATAGATFKAQAAAALFGISEGAAVSVSCTDQSR